MNTFFLVFTYAIRIIVYPFPFGERYRAHLQTTAGLSERQLKREYIYLPIENRITIKRNKI